MASLGGQTRVTPRGLHRLDAIADHDLAALYYAAQFACFGPEMIVTIDQDCKQIYSTLWSNWIESYGLDN